MGFLGSIFARHLGCLALIMAGLILAPEPAISAIFQNELDKHHSSGRYYIAYEGGYERANFQTHETRGRNNINAEMFSYGGALGYRMTFADILYNAGFNEEWLHKHPEAMNVYFSAEVGFYGTGAAEEIRLTVQAEDVYIHTDFTFEDKFRANLNWDMGYLFNNAFAFFVRFGYAFAHPEITLLNQFTSASPSGQPGNRLDNSETLADALVMSDHTPSETHYDRKMHGFALGSGLELMLSEHISFRMAYMHNFSYDRSEHAFRSGFLWRF